MVGYLPVAARFALATGYRLSHLRCWCTKAKEIGAMLVTTGKLRNEFLS